MILTPHILAGALVGAQTTNPIAAFVFGLVSHYLIDKIPHWDYDIKKIQEKVPRLKAGMAAEGLATGSRQVITQWLKIGFDLALPFLITGLLAPNEQSLTLSLIGAAGGILPDFLLYLSWQFPIKILAVHAKFHDKNHSKIKLGHLAGPASYLAIIVLFLFLYP